MWLLPIIQSYWITDCQLLFKYKLREKECKEIEEKNRMEKTWDLLKKIRDTKGTVNTKMGTIKDRNCMDLTEAEDIKKRWQGYNRTIQKRSSWPR